MCNNKREDHDAAIKKARIRANGCKCPGLAFAIGVFMVLSGLAGLCADSILISKSDAVPAVITSVSRDRHRHSSKVCVEYTYKNISFNRELNYCNEFTMKKGKKITAYIDPLHPDTPKVPASGFYTLFGALGIVVCAVNALAIRTENKER